MDWVLVAGIVGVGLIVILLALVMLNRAWGNFPGQASGLPSATPPSQTVSPGSSPFSAPPGEMAPPPMELPAGAPGSLVPVTHTLVRKAVLAALERGGSPYALYFIRDGETVYLVPSRIADPQQREAVTRMFTSLNSDDGGNMPLGEMLRALQEMGKR